MFKNYNEIEKFNEEVTEEIVSTPELEETAELETQETETDSDLVIGVVTNCLRLNVREKPTTSSPVISAVEALSELMVDVGKSDEEWYSVCTEAGIEGYCMRNFITISN